MSFESKGNNNRQIRKKDMRMSQLCNCEKYMKKYDQFGQVPSTAKYMVAPQRCTVRWLTKIYGSFLYFYNTPKYVIIKAK